MSKLYIFDGKDEFEITEIKKGWVTKYAQSWMYITENKTFTNKDNIFFKYTCDDCGKKSKPIKNNKKFIKGKEHFYCSSCVKIGSRNPFYGKTHSKETVDLIKIKNSKISKELWKDNSYREKVIKGVSKPRRESFKKEQSDRIKQWYIDNPIQREIRRKSMALYWKEERITPNVNGFSYNRSKGEKILFEWLKENLNYEVNNNTIHINGKWYLPDVIISDKVIVEYFGDYWHGNPKKFEENDIVAHNSKAFDVWKRDNDRIKILENEGYKVFIVWSSDVYEKSSLLNDIKQYLT